MHLGLGGGNVKVRFEHNTRMSTLWRHRSCSVTLWTALLSIPWGVVTCYGAQNSPPPNPQSLSKIDVDLLDDISRRAFRYFWEQASPRTGLILDRTPTSGELE